ncbi:EF-hand domain-containing protein [Marinobacter sp. X15-166B]|uniref:EF-hand domain-containing protein n=1 Tax=Marinobacter sp. X15-166B TaxID=1897620 RepID=UPI00085C3822|nr:EF-hand domain-containing protein [Marinobacter sp. X15-166B]OEY65294.1 hypothetical protein BG841_01670 [Marinobacter sp. X15-166B]
MKIKMMTLVTAVSLAMMSPLTMAASHGDHASDAMDSGKDHGKMMDSTASHMGAARFDELDTDGDGMLSEEELNVHGSTAAGQAGESNAERRNLRMDELDKDGDGAVGREEYEEYQMNME